MDILAATQAENRGKAKDAELAKAMYEGTKEYRRKLKLPELNDYGLKIKQEAQGQSYFAFVEDAIGKYYFIRFVQDVHAVHGNFLLQICSYRHAASADKRSIAHHCIDAFVQATGEIYNSEDADALLEAYEEGVKAQPKPGKKSNRQTQRVGRVDGYTHTHTCSHAHSAHAHADPVRSAPHFLAPDSPRGARLRT